MSLFIFLPKNDTLNIVGKNWNRSIEINAFRTVDEDAWHLPANARLHYTRNEIYEYERVLDHYETITEQVPERYVSGQETYVSGHRDLGNGYFEEITSTRDVYSTRYVTKTRQEPVYRKEPVYRTKYYYEIDKWIHDRYEVTSGTTENPYWKELTLPEDEKEGKKTEKYAFTSINKKGKKKTYKIDLSTWKELKIGDSIDVILSAGQIKEIKGFQTESIIEAE